MAKEPKINPKSLPPLHRIKYGCVWKPVADVKGNPVAEMPDWMIERDLCKAALDGREPKGSMGYVEHFKRLSDCFFSDPQGIFYFEWNPNAVEILERHRQFKRLACAGHASSSKSESMALIGLLEWFIDPFGTKVIFTSKTKASSKGKVWGSVCEAWQQLCRAFGGEQNTPGKLLSAQTMIKYSYNGVQSEKVGCELVPGEQAAADESNEKVQGYKRGRVILMMDELATISPSILKTAFSNLEANNDCSIVGGFNPDSYFDAGGMLSKPKNGWDSISTEDTGWETEVGGWCIHFDGHKSPNVLAGREIWRGLLTVEKLAGYERQFNGNHSKEYHKMVRGFWSPTGSLDCIFSEADIITYKGDHPVTTWMEQPVLGASLDPAFSHGGDNAVACIGKMGTYRNPDTGETQKVLEKIKTVILTDNVSMKNVSRSEQVVASFKKLLSEYNIQTSNVVVDATGGGDPFSALLARDIGTGFLMVGFKQRPSELQVSRNDKRKGVDRFADKVSELWYVMRELIRSGQIKGLDPDTINELTARTYKETSGKVKVEPKEQMKLRTSGKSPDRADAMALLCEWARQKHGLSSTEKPAPKKRAPSESLDPFLAGLFPQKKKQPLFADVPEPIGIMEAGWGD